MLCETSLIKPNDFLKTATPADSLIYINDAILCVNVKGSMSIYTMFSIGYRHRRLGYDWYSFYNVSQSQIVT
jgi:hypothetical protein